MTRFTPGELQIMQILWSEGELKPADIQQRYPEEIKNPALRSYLAVLLAKGHVTRRKVGKAYFYKAATRRRSAFRRTLRELINAYCDGSTQALLVSLLKSEKLSDQELLQLKRLAEAGETPEPSSPGKQP
jgi:predicted transcriptional regulator